MRQGEFLVLLGPSGCGKSTALNMIAGLMQPLAGTIRFDGAPITDVNTRVGYMTQKDNLLPWRTVSQNIAVALEIRGVPAAERAHRVQEMIELVGLAGFERHYPSELSGGMRKRTTLARTLVYSPDTLLMDEPFGALDAPLRMALHDQLVRLWQATKKTILFVTHDLTEALTLADRIIVLTPRPGIIKGELPVKLPRPRDIYQVANQPEFARLQSELWSLVKDDYSQAGRA